VKRIRIFGCKTNPILKHELRYAAQYFLNELIPRKRILDLSICVIPGFFAETGCFGECWQNDTHLFNIRLESDLNRKDILTTLAHEMVHVKQFSRRELCFGCGKDKWFGKVYPLSTPYSQQPWEKEANRLEKTLYKSYLNHFKHG